MIRTCHKRFLVLLKLSHSKLFIVIFSYLFLGVNSTELTIKTTVFSHYENVDKFQVRLMVTDPVPVVTGEVYLNLIRNHPPYGGQCVISPTEGVAFQDKFTISCSGFKDDEQQLASYRIRCKFLDLCSVFDVILLSVESM